MKDSPDYGVVLITNGKKKGKIGYFDDYDEYNKAIIYDYDPALCNSYYTINSKYITNIIPTETIIERIATLDHILYKNMTRNHLETDELNCVLYEKILCDSLLNERYLFSMNYIQNQEDIKIFISHASADMVYARSLATDLMLAGYSVFLDDWSIDVGDKILNKINEGLNNSKALIMIISKSYINSVCCNDEWSSFYFKTTRDDSFKIYPIIIDDSQPPAIISQIKYIRVDDNVSYLPKLIKALNKQFKNE